MVVELDYTPLRRRATLDARLRAITGSPRLLIAATVTALLLVVPPVILAVLLATVDDVDTGGIWVLGMLFLCGLWVAWDLGSQAGAADALAGFAEANGLELMTGTTSDDYAGSLFAAGSHRVQQGVRRTRGTRFVEIGDRFPTTIPTRAQGAHHPELYLRARLSGPVGPEKAVAPRIVTSDLHDRLGRLAGAYELELSGDELTVFGVRALKPRTRGRVEEAITLAEMLAERAEELVAATPGGPTTSGIPLPPRHRPPAAPATARSPWAVVGWTLLLLVVAPLGFAVVMSVLDDGLPRHPVLAATVVLGMVGLLLQVTRVVLMRLMGRPAGRRSSDPHRLPRP